MPNYCIMSVSALLLLSLLSFQPASGQTIKRNPDGTVEVSDDETPVQPVRASSRKSSSSSRRSGGASGRIPAYTKRMGGVTVKRKADGTIDIIDNETGYSSSGGSGSRKAGTSYGDGVAVTRHADGRVDVHDTTMSSGGSARRSASAKHSGRVGSYKVNHGDVAVKRNADGTVEVTDTSSSTRRK